MSVTAAPSPAPGRPTSAVRHEVEQFIITEARLCDESRYADWEALWADDDTLYWVAAGEDPDPARSVSYVYDNRSRLATRIRQLQTGYHYPQDPPSRLCRIISNLEMIESRDQDARPGRIDVRGNFLLVESRHEQTIWAGTLYYGLAPVEGTLRLVYKRVDLVNRDGMLPTWAFLL